MARTSDDTAILMRLSDPVRAEMIRDLLEGEGIAASTPGLEHRSMLGIAGGGLIEIVVRVPARDLERARELVAALDSADLVDDRRTAEGELDNPDLDDGEDEEPARELDRASVTYRESARGSVRQPPPHRYKRVAAFAALWLPFGGAHVYARQYRSAAIFAILMIGSFVALANEVWLAIVLPLAIMALDAIGSTWHCDHSNTGVAPATGGWRRFAAEIAVAVFALWIWLAPRAAEGWAGEHGRAFCTGLHGCGQTYDQCVQSVASARFDGVRVSAACARCAEAAETCEALERCDCW